jgi:exodeoxyribonuclease V alpha subunit
VTGNACRKKRDKPTQGTGGRYRLLRPMRHYHRIRLLAYEFAYNGDIGFVEAIDLELGEMTIAFDGRPVAYAFGELDQIVLAYATTIHKSQGSEYPAVVVPVTTPHYMMLQRNLLYTGVTRGKRLVILLGQKKAVAIAIKNVSGRRRWSKLREWLNPV